MKIGFAREKIVRLKKMKIAVALPADGYFLNL